MHTLRTRLAGDIVAEFIPSKNLTSRDVMIFCDGMPTMPNKKYLLQFAARKGYWAFHPRYRGTWESGGTFLDHSPADDIRDVMDALQKPIRSIWRGEEFQINPQRFILVGGSFGGPAALLLSKDPRVHKVICISPVVDWTIQSTEEPMDWLFDVTKESFGEAYRMSKQNWDQLKNGELYNPMKSLEKIDGKKVLIIHAVDDNVAPYHVAKEFAEKSGSQLIRLKKGGHLSARELMRWRVFWQVRKFLGENHP